MNIATKSVLFLIIVFGCIKLFAMQGHKTIKLDPRESITISFNNISGLEFNDAKMRFFKELKKHNIDQNKKNIYIFDKNTPIPIFKTMINLNCAHIEDMLFEYQINPTKQNKNLIRAKLNNLYIIASRLTFNKEIHNYSCQYYLNLLNKSKKLF